MQHPRPKKGGPGVRGLAVHGKVMEEKMEFLMAHDNSMIHHLVNIQKTWKNYEQISIMEKSTMSMASFQS